MGAGAVGRRITPHVHGRVAGACNTKSDIVPIHRKFNCTLQFTLFDLSVRLSGKSKRRKENHYYVRLETGEEMGRDTKPRFHLNTTNNNPVYSLPNASTFSF